MQFGPNSELELKKDSMLDELIPSLTRTPLSQRLSLSIDALVSSGPYPTSKMQKGPVLLCGSTDLSREGVGLGVPIAKFAHRVFFPGEARIIERLTDDQLRTDGGLRAQPRRAPDVEKWQEDTERELLCT